MTISRDIVATYRGPGTVFRRILAAATEARALVYLMAGCGLVFVAQLPRLARQAHLTGEDLNPLMGGSLMAWLFIAPLIFYLIATLSHVVAKVLGGQGDFFGARVALFWALLASSPLMLLNGLVAGFIGPGTPLQLVGIAWLAVFLWFWFAGLRQAERAGEAK
ncbi:YIP1 family protein [Chachezhania sediminis]|uniref:YIP1 family protein n=1 Tax=Chachezhania sediminis TaxID=2599291 RepID=UPI00131E1A64|nr:YIP1 family protein [Chachezhania sediminis]